MTLRDSENEVSRLERNSPQHVMSMAIRLKPRPAASDPTAEAWTEGYAAGMGDERREQKRIGNGEAQRRKQDRMFSWLAAAVIALLLLNAAFIWWRW